MEETSNPIHFYAGQWWFWDEAGLDRIGPFGTVKEADEGLRKYCVEVLGYKTEKDGN